MNANIARLNHVLSTLGGVEVWVHPSKAVLSNDHYDQLTRTNQWSFSLEELSSAPLDQCVMAQVSGCDHTYIYYRIHDSPHVAYQDMAYTMVYCDKVLMRVVQSGTTPLVVCCMERLVLDSFIVNMAETKKATSQQKDDRRALARDINEVIATVCNL